MTRPSMGLYECMPVIKSTAPNTTARKDTKEKYTTFFTNIRKQMADLPP